MLPLYEPECASQDSFADGLPRAITLKPTTRYEFGQQTCTALGRAAARREECFESHSSQPEALGLPSPTISRSGTTRGDVTWRLGTPGRRRPKPVRRVAITTVPTLRESG